MLLRRYSILALFAALLLIENVPASAVCREETFLKVPQSIQTIADDDSFVYFGTLTGRLQRVAKSSNVATMLTTAPGKVAELTVDASTIFYALPLLQADGTTKTTLYSIPKGGGTPTQLVEVNELVGTMESDATHLYWIVPSRSFSEATGKVQKVSKSGGSVTTLAQNLAVPYDLLIDGENVYFTEDGLNRTPPYGLSRVSRNGGSVTKIAGTRPGFEVLAVEGGNVIYSAWESDVNQGIYRVAATGGTPTALRSGLFSPSHFEKAGDKIYFSSARYDLSNGDQGALQVIEPSGNVATLSPSPVRMFVSDSEAIYAMPGVYASGRLERFCLNYATAPRIISFSGNAAPSGGTVVTVTGERFAAGARVTFDNLDAAVLSVTPTEIQVTVPAHSQGIVDVYVVNPNGESGRARFYYDPSIAGEGRKRAIRR